MLFGANRFGDELPTGVGMLRHERFEKTVVVDRLTAIIFGGVPTGINGLADVHLYGSAASEETYGCK